MSEPRGGLNFRRELLRKHRANARFFPPPSIDHILHVLRCDPASLDRAAEFFGLDHKHPPDLFLLALLLAEELFGKRKRGPRPGNKVWNTVKFLRLGYKYRDLKLERPRESDAKLAVAIAEDPEFRQYRCNPELIRQRLAGAKRQLEEQKRYEDWVDEHTDYGDDDYDDDQYSYLRN
jgi:hypothetical protein